MISRFVAISGNSKGYTLPEIICVLAIVGFISAGIYTAFDSGQKEYAVRQAVISMQQQARQAMTLLQKDLKMVGYGLADTGNLKINIHDPDSPRAIVQARDGNSPTAPAGAFAPGTDGVAFLLFNGDADVKADVFLSAPAPSSSPVDHTYTNSTGGFSDGDFYLVYDPTNRNKPASLLQITGISSAYLAHTPSSKFNPTGSAADDIFPTGGYPTGSRVLNLGKKALRQVKYYIDPDMQLIREQQDGIDGAVQRVPVAAGVEDLQVEYQFQNGQWRSEPVVKKTKEADDPLAADYGVTIGQLRAVRVSIIARTEKADPTYISSTPYKIEGSAGSGKTWSGGGYRRMTMSTIIQLRNLGLRN